MSVAAPSPFASASELASPAFVARWSRWEPSPRARPRVVHEHAALAFFVAGRASMELATTWSLEPGDVLLVPAGAPHRLLASTALSTWMVGLAPASVVAEQQLHLLEPFERVRDGGAAVVRMPGARQVFVEQLLTELQRELDGGREARVRDSLLTLLMAELARASALPSPGPTCGGDGARDEVALCLRHIERHCLRPLPLEELAALVHRSPAHVTTLLRKSTGKTAGQWILAGRMAEARRRLHSSDERVDVIAERVGYADPTHFTRLFRRVHGVTPAAFRSRRASARG